MSNDGQRVIAQTIALIFALPTFLYAIKASKSDLSIREEMIFSASTTIFLSYFVM